jgi:hypothetical protein
MIRLPTICAAMLALPIVMAATAADAQQRRNQSQNQNQMSDEAIAARQECFREAQARFPGPPGGNISVSSQRETSYRGCIQRKGFRP